MIVSKSLVLTFLFGFLYLFCPAQKITDSVFSIKNESERLTNLEIEFYLLDIHSDKSRQYKAEVMQRGNAAEKLLIEWMSEDRHLTNSNSDSSIAIFNKYLPLVKDLNNPQLLASLYSVKADALFSLKKYSAAFENYLYAYDNLKKDPEGKYYYKSWILYGIAFNFYLFKDYPKSIEIAEILSTLPTPNHYKPEWFNSLYFDLIGMAYLKKHQLDSAKHWFDKTYASSNKINDTIWMGIALGNLGLVNHASGQLEKAITQLETGISYCSKFGIWDNVALFAINLAEIHIKRNQLDLAKQNLDTAFYANQKNYKTENHLLYFNTLVTYEKARGNVDNAFRMIDSARYYESIVSGEFETGKKALAESRLAFEKQLMENKIKQEKSIKKTWLLYGMVVILFLIAAAAILFIKRQRLKHSLQNEKLQNEKLRAESDLSLALYEIKEFSHNISEKNKAIEKLTSKVKNLEQQQHSFQQETESREPGLTELTALRDEDWEDFYIMFDKAFPGMQQKFRTKLPELNEMELRYLMTLTIGIEEKKIHSMIHTNETGIKDLREGLVQKLHLTGGEEIEILLESL